MRSITTGGANIEYTPIGHTANLASRMQALARPARSRSATAHAAWWKAILRSGRWARQSQRHQRAGQRLRSHGTGPAAYAATTVGRPRTDQIRRARASETGDPASSAPPSGADRDRADRRGDRGAGRRQIATSSSSSRSEVSIRLDGAGDLFGLTWQGVGLSAIIELLHNYFGIAGDDDANAPREKITGKVLGLDPGTRGSPALPYALLGCGGGRRSRWRRWTCRLARPRTLDAIKRILLRESMQSPAHPDLRGSALARRGDPGPLNLLADPIGQGENPVLGELPARVLTFRGTVRPSVRGSSSTRWAGRAPRRCFRRCLEVTTHSSRSKA